MKSKKARKKLNDNPKSSWELGKKVAKSMREKGGGYIFGYQMC